MIELQELLNLLERFHITDRSVLRARDAARRGGDRAFDVLRRETARYFSSLQRESGRQLKDIDRKLDDLYQRQYNLQAERGIAERRRLGALEVLQMIGADPTLGETECLPQP